MAPFLVTRLSPDFLSSKTFPFSPRQGKQSLPHAERSRTQKGCYGVAQEQRLWGVR